MHMKIYVLAIMLVLILLPRGWACIVKPVATAEDITRQAEVILRGGGGGLYIQPGM